MYKINPYHSKTNNEIDFFVFWDHSNPYRSLHNITNLLSKSAGMFSTFHIFQRSFILGVHCTLSNLTKIHPYIIFSDPFRVISKHFFDMYSKYYPNTCWCKLFQIVILHIVLPDGIWRVQTFETPHFPLSVRQIRIVEKPKQE